MASMAEPFCQIPCAGCGEISIYKTRKNTMRNISTIILPLILAPLVSAQDIPLSQIIPEKSNWAQVRQIDKKVLAIAGNTDGSILIALENEVIRLDKSNTISKVSKAAGIIAILPQDDGSLYLSHPKPARILHVPLGKDEPEVFCEGLAPTAMALLSRGKFFADLPNDPSIYLVEKNSFRKVDDGPCASLALDQSRSILFAGTTETMQIATLRVKADGNLDARDYYVAPRKAPPGASALVTDLKVDSLNRIYAATSIGVQVFDPTGRLCGVLTNPNGKPGFITIAGETLYCLSDGKLFSRPLLFGKK